MVGEFKVIEKHNGGQCRSVTVWPADVKQQGSGSNEDNDEYTRDIGQMTFFSGMPIVGRDLVPWVLKEDENMPSTDLEVMIEPTLPEDYDADDGVVSEKHDGQEIELRITFPRWHSEYTDPEVDTATSRTCTGCLRPAEGLQTLLSVSQSKFHAGKWLGMAMIHP